VTVYAIAQLTIRDRARYQRLRWVQRTGLALAAIGILLVAA